MLVLPLTAMAMFETPTRQTHHVAQHQQNAHSVHVPHLLYPLMDVFRVKTMVFETVDQLNRST
jgi:hypothetical protein